MQEELRGILLDEVNRSLDGADSISRSVLGLSAGGIGLMVGLLRDANIVGWQKQTLLLGMVLFLLSIIVWLGIRTIGLRLRHEAYEYILEGMTSSEPKKAVPDEGELNTWLFVQRLLFLLGVCLAAAPTLAKFTN